MFATALATVRQFTKPVITSVRYFDGTVECGIGAYVLLNNQGWIATASHVFLAHQKHRQDETALATYRQQEAAIQADPRLTGKQKIKKIRGLHSNSKWITNFSLWWGVGGERVQQIQVLDGIDLCVGQLSPFVAQDNAVYPVLKNPASMREGTSLCRLGYPFHQIKATYDEATNSFALPPEVFPIAEFPNEGIFTRVHILPQPPGGNVPLELIETSSPGLRGQSGGPIFDTAGNVWAIQSDTLSLPLEFSPTVTVNGRLVVEHQFLNVGRGVHARSLIGLLTAMNVDHQVSPN